MEIGKTVVMLTILAGADKAPVEVPALVTGIIPTTNPDVPALTLAYINPKRLELLEQADWRNSVDRAYAVKHESHDDVQNSAEGCFWNEISDNSETAADSQDSKTESINEQAARLAHEANRAYCVSIGDNSQPAWKDAPDWQRTSAINGVAFHFALLASGKRPSPSQSHESWLKEKADAGWKYGPTKDVETKEHPCFVPYDELPAEQRMKDVIFGSVVEAVFNSNIEVATGATA